MSGEGHNQFAATCYRCGKRVAIGDGLVSYAKHDHRVAWPQIARLRNVTLTEHVDCARRYKGTFIHFQYQPEVLTMNVDLFPAFNGGNVGVTFFLDPSGKIQAGVKNSQGGWNVGLGDTPQEALDHVWKMSAGHGRHPLTYELFVGDCLDTMRQMPSGSVHCCVTSPPYYMLRDYETDGQIGMESTPEAYVKRLVEVFHEMHRVLRDDGVFWLVIGDTYAGGGAGSRDPDKWPKQSRNDHRLTHAKRNTGLKNGDMIGIPWMLAFALRADGWWLRQDVIWRKPNPMPESVKNRCTRSHEYVFMFSKSAKYFYDFEAVKEPAVSTKAFKFTDGGKDKQRGHGRRHEGFNGRYAEKIADEGTPTTRNLRSVWDVATKPYRGAHFATFPEELITPCIIAGCPVGGTVLDPFGGSGTTAAVAIKHGRRAILCELNAGYAGFVESRVRKIAGNELARRAEIERIS